MNLNDIQSELRSIELRVQKLYNVIDDMKPKSEDQREKEFEAIYNMAKDVPIQNEMLAKTDPNIQQHLLSGLFYIAMSDAQGINIKLLYLCRLIVGCSIPMSLKDLYMYGMQFNEQNIREIAEYSVQYRDFFIVEALIVSNITGEASPDMMSLISQIGAIMGLKKEEMRLAANVARCVLTANWNQLQDPPVSADINWEGRFASHIPEEWFKLRRVYVKKICVTRYIDLNSSLGGLLSSLYAPIGVDPIFTASSNDVKKEELCDIQQSVRSESFVRKNQLLLEYKNKTYSDSDKKNIRIHL